MPMRMSTAVAAIIVVLGSSLAAAEGGCDRWSLEGLELGMSLDTALRIAPPTTIDFVQQHRSEARGRQSYPWFRGTKALRVTVDHSLPGEPVVRIVFSDLDQRLIEELRMLWLEPNHRNETEHVQQYVWYDHGCRVRARATLIEDYMIVSISRIN